MNKEISLENYKLFLEALRASQYDFIFFDELNHTHQQAIIRHDIDFDVIAALQMAELEHSMGVKAIYFFMISSSSYNPFDQKCREAILEIKKLGHQISIHFDPTIYDDFEKGYLMEKQLFEVAFNTSVNIISLHRPNDYFLKYDQPILNDEHTYMNKYFRDIKYVSDSTGVFRYGHPFDTDEFKAKQSLHILIHPVWWMFEGNSNYNTLKTFFAKRKAEMKSHFSNNCKPFKEIEHEIN